MWLTKQRQLKKKGKLEYERQIRLEELGVVWDTHKYEWEEMFTLLVDIKRRTGNCNVPTKHKEGGEKIGLWLSKQRQIKKRGKLEYERQRQLDELGVVWQLK